MSTVSPPNTSPPSTGAPPPTTGTRAQPPQSPPPDPSSQPNATPPVSTSPPIQSPPPPPPSPPITQPSAPPRSPPPPPLPPSTITPPPPVSSPSNPNSPPSVPPSAPPTQRNSPPPPPPATQRNSPPPPPPVMEPPTPSPPPIPPQPNSPPPPRIEPPTVPPLSPSSPPPPPRRQPPESSPPPSSSTSPPADSPPPTSESPPSSPPPPRLTPPTSQPTPSPSNPVSPLSPPQSVIRLAPPPPPRVPVQPSDDPTVNTSTPNSPESSGSPSSSGIGVGGTVAIGVAVGIIVLSLIGLVAWCLRKQKKKHSVVNGGYVMPSPLGSSPRSDSSFIKTQSSAPHFGSSSSSGILYSTPSEPGGLGHSRSWFTYEELLKATNGFSEQNLLGEGGFGAVYKGFLPDGREAAVKQLKIGGGQGEREFKAEVEIISRIHHRHLVSLVGYCISESRRLLVYDFVPNNNLYFHLHGKGSPVLEWAKRIKIAAGAARGIAYLHEDCFPRVIHRDIKSSNILIDNNFEARVSDFGLAKLALDANTHVTTRVMGTFGYMAPEYASSGKLTEKSDVFSYGVVLLELITGRKPVDTTQPIGDESLVEWARPLLSHALETQELGGLVDPWLGQNYMESEMFQMVEVAAVCVRHSSVKRPRMGQVVRAFDALATSDLSNGMKVGESEVFNSAQQSEEIRWFRRMAFGSQNYSTDFFSQSVSGS